MLKTVLVIGVHAQELPFGERVAECLQGTGIDIFRIQHGLNQNRSLYRDIFYYRTFHRELYLQFHRQIQDRYDLVIDLHAGINESGHCADIICGRTAILDSLQLFLSRQFETDGHPLQKIRLMQIVKDSARLSNGCGRLYPVCRTFIPERIWNGKRYHYVGLEVYLPLLGEGSFNDWRFAAKIVKCIRDSAE